MINNLVPFDERLNVGYISEKKFTDKCIIEKISYINTKIIKGWSSDLDLKIGDFLIFPFFKSLFIDVKGGAISKKSILNFEKDYFVIYENSNESGINGLVFKPQILRNIIKNFKEKDFDKLAFSGDLGISYSRLKDKRVSKYASYSIEDFFKLISINKKL